MKREIIQGIGFGILILLVVALILMLPATLWWFTCKWFRFLSAH